MNKTVWLLTLAQALAMSATPIMVLLGGIVGAQLSPTPELATLPLALTVVGVALTVIPASRLMRRYGRRVVFLLGSLWGAGSGLLAMAAIQASHFWLFCFSGIMLGGAASIVLQYRFAAMEAVPVTQAAKAASRVLLGGLAAAIIGPELAVFGESLLTTRFAGAFMMLSLICLASFVVLLFYREPESLQDESSSHEAGRPLPEILSSPMIWVAILGGMLGYALMSLIMTATPLHMHHHGSHSLADTKWVIQSHIIAMYLPSLFSGWLIARLGIVPMMLAGLVAYLATVVMALSGSDLLNYWSALVLLGIGWNFLFVGATALLPNCYRPVEKFRVQAFNDSFVFSAQAVASLSAGWLLHSFGWQTLLLSTLPFIGMLLIVIASWQWRQRAVSQA
ncbi:MFS transporter [Shewanella submarina]|uniref:MFS transporter n=1 Tax=Shewanella submarina TaxID=2016376 RepID=A0ABV7GAI9_9GAMM|nr:MFS transporter [Shewanella submarina]MCL1039364.1 MFS transporter [Shewanella submarina]